MLFISTSFTPLKSCTRRCNFYKYIFFLRFDPEIIFSCNKIVSSVSQWTPNSIPWRFPSYLFLYFIFYLSRCTLPDFPSVFSLASLPFLSCCYRTTTYSRSHPDLIRYYVEWNSHCKKIFLFLSNLLNVFYKQWINLKINYKEFSDPSLMLLNYVV